jgi:phosphorylcholine metabolism protein LicD
MVRAYLTFFRENKLDTWIAHGTLLGWWWNGRRLPWDLDIDTQVSENTLYRMGRDFNQTRYKYTSPDHSVKREYLLDVNPYIKERVRGDGMNVIDARWIDIRNGLYIDITGLSETQPESDPGVFSCKNYHRYKTDELYPMRETMFEGAIAKVPYAYDKILTDEYQERALVNTDFNGYV